MLAFTDTSMTVNLITYLRMPKETQFSDNVHEFKKRILPLHKTYVDFT